MVVTICKRLNWLKKRGMPVTISLDDGPDHIEKSLGHLNRILILKAVWVPMLWHKKFKAVKWVWEITIVLRKKSCMSISIDYIFMIPDEKQQEKNLGHLLDRIRDMNMSIRYICRRFLTPMPTVRGYGVFPKSMPPMRAEIYLIVSLNLESNPYTGRACVCMDAHYLLGNCPKKSCSKDLVVTQQAHAGDRISIWATTA